MLKIIFCTSRNDVVTVWWSGGYSKLPPDEVGAKCPELFNHYYKSAGPCDFLFLGADYK